MVSLHYINAMNTVSENYKTYKDAEFEYERAYAVWEYANTPYLKDTFVHDSELGDGKLPGTDEVEDYSDIQVPDARENYEYILQKYNEAHQRYSDAMDAMENQETIEMLRLDDEYESLRKAFEDTTIAYINNPIEENLTSRTI